MWILKKKTTKNIYEKILTDFYLLPSKSSYHVYISIIRFINLFYRARSGTHKLLTCFDINGVVNGDFLLVGCGVLYQLLSAEMERAEIC